MHGAILERRNPHRIKSRTTKKIRISHRIAYKLDSSVCLFHYLRARLFICVCMCVWFEVGRTKEDLKSWLISLPQLCVVMTQSIPFYVHVIPYKKDQSCYAENSIVVILIQLLHHVFSNKNKNRQTPSNLVSFFLCFNSAYQKLLRVRVCECVLLLLLLRVRTDWL